MAFDNISASKSRTLNSKYILLVELYQLPCMLQLVNFNIMNRLFYVLVAFCFGVSVSFGQRAPQTPRCGLPYVHEKMIEIDSSWGHRFRAQKAALQGFGRYYQQYKKNQAAEKSTNTISPIPIIFHIIVDSAQFLALGGTDGIQQRCDSQIAVLNNDYNALNYDTMRIPSAWKDSLFGNSGIHFGLARTTPAGHCSPGFEVKIISGSSTTDAGFSDENSSFSSAKHAGTGLNAWDITKYLNVWCINYTGFATGLLGLTVPLSSTGTCMGCTPVNEEGICILYSALGSTGSSNVPPTGTGNWDLEFGRGRTLTHEIGHFFEIWHPWGDDGGQCPTWSSSATIAVTGLSSSVDNGITCTPGVGQDDGLSDTPPESDAVYGSPFYTIPGGTTADCCQMCGSLNTQPIGIACLSYMDYTDDTAMHLFTPQQAAAMASMVLVPPSSGTGATGVGTIGENYNLTQNPSLLVCPAAVYSLNDLVEVEIYPNPTNGIVNITFNSTSTQLEEVTVQNLVGQTINTYAGTGKDYFSVDLSSLNKGIYFIRCSFSTGTITRRILLD